MAGPTTDRGYRSVYTAVQEENILVRVLGDRIVQLQPDVTPLLVMTTNAKRKKATPTPRIERIEDDLRTLWDQNQGAALGPGATTISVANSNIFAYGDLVAVLSPGTTTTVNASPSYELLRVTTASGNVITVTRGVGGSSATIAASSSLRIVGSAFQEGDNYGIFRSTEKTVVISYCQIFRTPVQITRSMQATRTYGEQDYQYQKAKALMEHKKEIEAVGLWGKASESLAQPTTLWTSMGTRSRIQTNVQDFLTTATLTEFNAFSELAFRYGSPAKLLIAAPRVISAINFYSQNKLLTEVGQTVFGVNIRRLTLPHGEYMLARNWLMEQGVAGAVGFQAECYSIDLNNIEFCYLADQGETRDTQYRENVVQTGVDAEQDEWYTQAGWMITQEKVHALGYDISSYA